MTNSDTALQNSNGSPLLGAGSRNTGAGSQDGGTGSEIRLTFNPGSILSVESNQNVESKTKNVESRTEKCGVQNSIFTSRNQLF